MDVTPTDRTAPNGARYAEYLQSAEWRRTRDEALRRAKWRCSECESKRDLQVHHRTYERVGHERPEDLVVLCVGCHEDEHPQEAEHDYVRHYLKIAQGLINDRKGFESISELSEVMKIFCARAHLPYNTERVWRALKVVLQREPKLVAPKVVQQFIRDQEWAPIGPDEARLLLRKYGMFDLPKRMQMPDARLFTEHQATKILALQLVNQEIQASIARCEALEAEHGDDVPPSSPVSERHGDMDLRQADGDRGGDSGGGDHRKAGDSPVAALRRAV